MNKKPQLLTYLNGMPDIESMYPVLARLHARGKINVRAFVYSKQLRKETRLSEAFQSYGFIPELGSKLSIKFFFQKAMREADAVLSISDPLWDSPSRKRRANYLFKLNKPCIFLQHGAYQLGVNGRLTDGDMNYYSKKLLFWEPLAENRDLFADGVTDRTEIVGFTKQNILPMRKWSAEVEAWKAKYPRRLLVCQSFRWGHGRFTKDSIKQLYDLIEDIIARDPDIGIVIRSHRGKTRKNHKYHDNRLEKKYPNILFSRYYSGLLAKATIHDALDLCHAMISPTSTTVLDCAYSGKPAAVFDEGLKFFPDLPQINDAQDVESFLKQIDEPGPEQGALIKRFGQFDENLDRASAAIEDLLLSKQT